MISLKQATFADASSNVADIPRLPAVAKAASVAASKPTGSRGKLLEHALERQRKLTAQAAVVQQKSETAPAANHRVWLQSFPHASWMMLQSIAMHF